VSAARDQILAGVRRALGKSGGDGARKALVDARIETHARNLVPKRAELDRAGQLKLFLEMAEKAAATVARVRHLADVPGAVADFLAAQNLPARLRLAPDPALTRLPWSERALLKIETGTAQGSDTASLTPAFAGIAETGTLMLVSGPETPTTLNFLPDNHLVLLSEGQLVGPYEDAWDRLRAAYRGEAWPRTVNFITGPSRSADIEQQLQMGAHGPRRLHIILVAEGRDGEAQG
jgi:L-lactate dehydrogenase complex protein LldG